MIPAGYELRGEELELLLEATDDGIIGVDLEGRGTFVNAAAARMLGYERERLRGADLHGLVHQSREDGSPDPCGECPVCAAIAAGESRRVEGEVFWRGDGTSFPVEYCATPSGSVQWLGSVRTSSGRT